MNMVIVIFFSKCILELHLGKVKLILVDYSDVCTRRKHRHTCI